MALARHVGREGRRDRGAIAVCGDREACSPAAQAPEHCLDGPLGESVLWLHCHSSSSFECPETGGCIIDASANLASPSPDRMEFRPPPDRQVVTLDGMAASPCRWGRGRLSRDEWEGHPPGRCVQANLKCLGMSLLLSETSPQRRQGQCQGACWPARGVHRGNGLRSPARRMQRSRLVRSKGGFS